MKCPPGVAIDCPHPMYEGGQHIPGVHTTDRITRRFPIPQTAGLYCRKRKTPTFVWRHF